MENELSVMWYYIAPAIASFRPEAIYYKNSACRPGVCVELIPTTPDILRYMTVIAGVSHVRLLMQVINQKLIGPMGTLIKNGIINGNVYIDVMLAQKWVIGLV